MMGEELHWSQGVLPVFDVETTGVDTATARIVSASFLLTTPKGRTLPGGYVTVVDPGCEIPAEAAAIHGITTERARAEGVPARKAVEEIITKVQGVFYLNMPLVGMNIRYDWAILHHEAERHSSADAIPDVRLLDPYVIDRGMDKFRKGPRKLSNLVEFYGVQMDAAGAHDAKWDCLATAEVLRAQFRRWPELMEMTLDQLQDMQREWYADWIASLSRFRVQKGEPPTVEAPWPGWPPLEPAMVGT